VSAPHRLAAATLAAALPALAAAQPTNHIGGPMADILVRNGCEMPEDALVAAMNAEGWGVGDVQAQVTALAKGGYFAVERAPGALRLQNWGACS
jgi:hypothetical protein